MDFIILVILALTPCISIGVFFGLKKTIHPTPSKILFISVGYGLLSFLIVLAISYFIRRYTDPAGGDLIYQIVYTIVLIGLLEEGAKFFFLRVFAFKNLHFNSAFDGIIHSVMIGMGFALAENFIYVMMGDGGSLIVRMATAIPAHTAFAIIMGYFVGEAKVFPSSRNLFSWMGLFFAAFAHGYYDFFLLQDNIPGLWWQSIIALIIAIGITFKTAQVRESED